MTWTNDNSTTTFDRFRYAYDRNSNRLYLNLLPVKTGRPKKDEGN